jgi:hypothetical protein
METAETWGWSDAPRHPSDDTDGSVMMVPENLLAFVDEVK